MHFQHRCCSLIESICVQQNERRRGRGKERGEGSRCTRAAIVRLVTREACTRYFWEVNGPDYEVQVLRSVTVPVIHSIPPPTVSRRRDFRFVQKPSSLFKTYLSILLSQYFLRYYSLYILGSSEISSEFSKKNICILFQIIWPFDRLIIST